MIGPIRKICQLEEVTAMKSIFEWALFAALALGLVVLLPTGAQAQKEGEQVKDEEVIGEDEEEAEEEAEEGDAEAESEEAGAEVEAEASADASLFASDDEEIPGDEPEEADEGEPKVLQGTWTKRIVFASDDGLFKFRPFGFVQPEFRLAITPEHSDQDAPFDNVLEGTGFLIRRGRLGFCTHFFDWARIHLAAGFGTGVGRLVDYFVDLDPFDGLVALRVGHFRPWFGRQFLQTETQLLMAENAVSWRDPALGMGLRRDLGLSLFGMVSDVLEYGVGVWNGDGGFGLGRAPDPRTPGNIDFQLGGRIAVHPLAPEAAGGRPLKLGDESDTELTDKPALVVGASVLYNKRHDRFTQVGGVDALYYDNQLKFGVEAAIQWIGITLQGEFFFHKVWIQDDADPAIKQVVEQLGSLDGSLDHGSGFGAYGQLGYFVMPQQLEIAARFDMVDEDQDVRGMRMYPGAGATYYFHGNNLKAQLMYRLSVGPGYEKDADATTPGDQPDPGYVPTGHEIFLMLQASI
jgi:hypothetical protein